MPLVAEIPRQYAWIWYGHLSYCDPNGAIVQFVRNVIQENVKDITLSIPSSDGISDLLLPECRHVLDPTSLPLGSCVVGVIATRNVSDPRIVLLPLDDESFQTGVEAAVCRRVVLPPWESRKAQVFWRGQCSGGLFPTLRYKVVEKIHTNPLANVRLIRDPCFPLQRMGDMNMNDDAMFSDRCPLEEHMQFKYTLIIDGALIASSHQWMFASGCVPLMVSYPNNDYWFKRYLKPGVHYVPVNYDLSDLEDKLAWLVANDDAAKEIADNAMNFARTILSAEFQQQHLRSEIERAANV